MFRTGVTEKQPRQYQNHTDCYKCHDWNTHYFLVLCTYKMVVKQTLTQLLNCNIYDGVEALKLHMNPLF
jgi:hypothetical protein